MRHYFSYSELEMLISELDWTKPDCMTEISGIRLLLEDAYTGRVITLHQWRVLWEDISGIQTKCALLRPDAWRRPRFEGLATMS
jgi:hypothetical protein